MTLDEPELLEKLAEITPEPKKRNFIVFFHNKATGLHATYNMQTDGGYVRNVKTKSRIVEQFGFRNISEVNITNIIELNDSDFNDWIS